jgi:hypothetical protein
MPLQTAGTSQPREDFMGKYFNLAETEPIIADCIRKIYRRKKDWVLHEEIVQCLLNDPIGKDLVETAFRRWKSKLHKSPYTEWKTPMGLAGNIVAWFGQRIKVHRSPHEKEFETTKNKPYNYKPKQNA